ncbi:hypothetical protein GC163_19975 [bacterium]|nr:hypothetical protein [bacterium]
MSTTLQGRNGVYLGAQIKEVFTGKEKTKKNKDGTDYKSTTRLLKIIGMGYEKSFFFSGEDGIKAFDALPKPEAVAEKRFDIVAPVETGRDGKDRLGIPVLYPAGAIAVTRPPVGTVAAALDESTLPGARRAA